MLQLLLDGTHDPATSSAIGGAGELSPTTAS
jgi:hypothetical protein